MNNGTSILQKNETLYKQITWEANSNRVFISSGFNCDSGCLYCYIFDEGYSHGFPITGKLSGNALRKLLVGNRNFHTGKYGTIIAFGCISDPFHPRLEAKTLEYIQALSDLCNPIQFATKFPLTTHAFNVISSVSNPIYPMITVTTLRQYRVLEPNAPAPTARLALINKLSKTGFKTTLYFKPVIPGINDNEHETIIQAAKASGASYLVAGKAYLNERIFNRLRQAGFDTSDLSKRGVDTMQPVWVKSKISPVRSHEILNHIVSEARRNGLKAFKDSVCVISDDLGISCPIQANIPECCSGHEFSPISSLPDRQILH
jgi:DNA repair photolyase